DNVDQDIAKHSDEQSKEQENDGSGVQDLEEPNKKLDEPLLKKDEAEKEVEEATDEIHDKSDPLEDAKEKARSEEKHEDILGTIKEQTEQRDNIKKAQKLE